MTDGRQSFEVELEYLLIEGVVAHCVFEFVFMQ